MNQKITKNNIAKIEKKIFIFDGHNLIYKSYFALPKLFDSKNRPTGAIQGTCNILMKFLTKYQNSMFCIASDSGGQNFRHEIFEDYKANRAEIEDDLRLQIIAMQEIYDHFGIKKIGAKGFEADDYIASFVKKFAQNNKIFIISSDKDLMSLVSENVFLIDPVKEDLFDTLAVEEKFGVRPSFIKDYLSLIGDSSDNIPGVPGIGPKTAQKILLHGHLDDLIKNNFENIKDQKLVQKLKLNLDSLLLSIKLVEMKDDLEINLTLNDLEFSLTENARNIYNIFIDHDLLLLSSRIQKFLSFDEFEKKHSLTIKDNIENNFISDEFLEKIYLSGIVYINYIENKDNIFELQILGRDSFIVLNNFDEKNLLILSKIMNDSSIKKITYKIHYGLNEFLSQKGIKGGESIFDLSWIYFSLIGVRANENFQYLVKFAKQFAFVNQIQFDYQDYMNLKENYIFSFELLFDFGLKALLKTKQINHLEIDRQVYAILLKMEHEGILLDIDKLSKFSQKLESDLLNLKEKIIDETGYDFNVISPKQTSEVLFEKLEITPIGKKSSKTSLYSTDTKVLEELSINGHIIADYILEYRSLNKLKTSYCQTLPEKINPQTGRIHTKFWLNGTTTGRILSSDPNLQNIPIRTDSGKEIRKSFVASDQKFLLSVDYSQIELRILAKLANVKNLINAFENELDVHKITASEIFEIPLSQVDDFQRTTAKAVNFGIIYGISPYGLSWRLKISLSQASSIIKKYFLKYPEIEDYVVHIKKFFHENGYVCTLLGRRCYAPHFSEEDSEKISFSQNQFLQRSAINAPIQGSSAEILKFALIACINLINERFSKNKILLQIHDEIIFEVCQEDSNQFSLEVTELMESIGSEFDLKLKVESSIGKYWE